MGEDTKELVSELKTFNKNFKTLTKVQMINNNNIKLIKTLENIDKSLEREGLKFNLSKKINGYILITLFIATIIFIGIGFIGYFDNGWFDLGIITFGTWMIWLLMGIFG